jgi:DNA invertase Pin-like site-specific DNA recombinase
MSAAESDPSVIIYRRVSTAEQGDSRLGMEAQRGAILTEMEQRGWSIAGEYEDVASGRRISGRPGLAQAIEHVRKVSGVLVASKLDRVSRDVIDFASLLRDAERQGWSVLVLDLQLDTTTPVGRFTAVMLANAAEFERRQIGERTRAALAAKKARGARLGRPRQTPQALVDRVVRDRDGGSTWQAIADGLNADGMPTQRGGTAWRVSTVQRLYESHRLDEEAASRRKATRWVAQPVADPDTRG